MKKHNASKVALITVLVFFLLTWILPAATFSGEYTEQGRNQMGLYHILYYVITSLSNFVDIIFYLVLVGGFYGILYKIPGYRSFLDAIVRVFKGKEKILLSVFIVLIALFVSVGGVQVGIAVFIPFIVSIILLMGYDKIVAGLVTVGSIAVGLIGSTYAGSNLNALTSLLKLNAGYRLDIRFTILCAGIILVIFNTLMYIKRHFSEVKIVSGTKKNVVEEKVEEKAVAPVKEVKKTTTKSSKSTKTTKKSTKKSSSKTRKSVNKAALKEEEVIVVRETVKENAFIPAAVNEKHSTWPFIVLFSLLFVLFVLAFMPWDALGVKVFSEATTSVQNYKLFGFPIFAKILGMINPFGNWSFVDLLLPMLIVDILLVVIYRVKLSDAFDGFIEGAKKAIEPAVIVTLLYTIFVIVYYHGFALPIYKMILGWSKGFNVATTSLVALVSGLFNPDMSFSFQGILQYYVSIVSEAKNYELVGIIFQSMYGLVSLAVPTSITLMVTLSYLKVSYLEWLKNTWKLLVELLAVLLITFIILALL